MLYTHGGTVKTQSGLCMEDLAETDAAQYAYPIALWFCPPQRIFLFYVSIHKKYELQIYNVTRF